MNQTTRNIGTVPTRDNVPRRKVESIDRRTTEDGNLSLRSRLIELETEHLRLQRLVAELLIKNQKLREIVCEQAETSTAAAGLCRGGDATARRLAWSH